MYFAHSKAYKNSSLWIILSAKNIIQNNFSRKFNIGEMIILLIINLFLLVWMSHFNILMFVYFYKKKNDFLKLRINLY